MKGPFSNLPTQDQITQQRLNENAAGVRYNANVRPRLVSICKMSNFPTTRSPSPTTFSGPFTGFYVARGTQTPGSLNIPFKALTMVVNAQSDQDVSNGIIVNPGDAGRFNIPVRQVTFIFNSANESALANATIWLFTDADFQPSSVSSLYDPGFEVITSGSVMTPIPAFAPTTTATQIVGSPTGANKITLQNIGTVNVYISGDASVKGVAGGAGTPIGIRLLPGDSYEWINQDSIWAITDSGTGLLSINQET